MSIITKVIGGILDSRRTLGPLVLTFGERPSDDYNGVTEDNYMKFQSTTNLYGEQNFGASEDIIVGLDYSPGESIFYRTLIKFDISSLPSEITITSAILHMYCYNTTFNWGVDAWRLIRNWNEGDNDGIDADLTESCWESAQEGFSDWSFVGAGEEEVDRNDTRTISFQNVGTTGWKSFDVTEDVTNFHNGRYPNYGWVFVMYSEGGTQDTIFSFRSSQYMGDTSLRPYLEIQYEIAESPPVPSCIPETRTTLTQVAPSLNGGIIYDMISSDVYGQGIYATDGGILQLFTSKLWQQKAPQYGSVSTIRGLYVYEEELYGGGNDGYLLKWNGVNAWTLVGTTGNSKDCWGGMTIHNGNLYVTYDGELWEWDGSTFSKVADEPISGLRVFDLVSTGGILYMVPYGAGAGGYLWRWNGISWVDVHDNTNIGIVPTYLVEIDGILYSNDDAGGVYSTDGTGWTYEGSIPNQNLIQRAVVQDATIYVCSDYTSRIGRWNPQCGGESVSGPGGSTKASIVVHDGNLYLGLNNGELEIFE